MHSTHVVFRAIQSNASMAACWTSGQSALAPNPLDAIAGAAEMTRAETRAYEAMKALVIDRRHGDPMPTDQEMLDAGTAAVDYRTARKVLDRRFKLFDAN
jgi:hypothetical protein